MSNNGWTAKTETDCALIANRAEAFVWLCNTTSNQYNKINTILQLIIAIGGYILGSTGIPTLFITDNWPDAKYINLAIQIGVIIVGILGTIIKLLNYTDNISQYNLISFRYSTLFVDIKKELKKESKHRTDFASFYGQISDTELDIKQTGIYIPTRIINEYYTKMGTSAIKYEDLFIEHINIQPVFELNKYL